MRQLLAILFTGLSFAMGSALFAQTAEPAKAILILDASGSMWGKVDGKAKIEIAREAVHEIVSQWNPSDHLGLMAYGHRSKGDCNDIELLIPSGPVDPVAFRKAVDGLTPKGKTPLTDAVLQAAQALRSSEEKATVILVSDGLETCGKDPCAAAEQLEKEGFDFTAHVIGFDLKAEEQKGIRCLADKTGGVFLAAADADSLKQALETAVRKTVEPTPTPTPEATPTPEPEATTTNVQLKTVLTKGGEEVESYFEIRKPGEKEVIARGGTGKFALEPGTYEVTATWGKARVSENVEIPKEASFEWVLTYEAGLLRLQAEVTSEGEKAEAYFTIYRVTDEIKGKRERIDANAKAEFKLPAGRYVAEASWGKATASQEVEVKAGEITEATLAMEAGILRMAATLGESEAADEAYYTIFAGKPKLDGSRDRIAYGTHPEQKLPAGTYLVEAKWGKATATAEVEVKGGERTEVSIAIPGGVLAVTAQDASGAKVSAYINVYRLVSKLSDKYERINWGIHDLFKLPEGKYRVSAKIGDEEVTTEAEVKAGERTEVTLKPVP